MPEVTCGPFPWPIADKRVLAALEKAYHDGSWGVYHGPDCAALVEELSAPQSEKAGILSVSLRVCPKVLQHGLSRKSFVSRRGCSDCPSMIRPLIRMPMEVQYIQRFTF